MLRDPAGGERSVPWNGYLLGPRPKPLRCMGASGFGGARKILADFEPSTWSL